MKYIVGLGNPGAEYAHTRHNVGWMVLDMFVERGGLPAPHESNAFAGRVSDGVVAGEDVTVLYPSTYMNHSGRAVAKLVPASDVGNLVVVYDDIDLPVGELKVSVGRGHGGHNGVKSIIEGVGSKDFVRVRVGIAPRSFWTGQARRPEGGAPLTAHVLGAFSKSEKAVVTEVAERAVGALHHLLTHSVTDTMTMYNRS